MKPSARSLPDEPAPADRAAHLAMTRIPVDSPNAVGAKALMRSPIAKRGLGALAAALTVLLNPVPSAAQSAGLMTRPSTHDVRVTIDRFAAAVRRAGWVVFTEIDHAAAAQGVGMTLLPRTVVVFGNPRAGTPAMAGHPTLALDLPMRVLVWQDETGRTFITRSTGDDLAERVFARHGINVPAEGRRETEFILEDFVKGATE
ncbi:DUF302 domain-containing protein [Roseomonas hellenica]|uniref:DUF302 domain-containing protein n=1 Tax=Plastoroseomonas hellenica TaxID=2687306 RepID=A0ABS5EWK5_9PROT|nr:DUF302 domain-containing protein [Plastoroseomonas hellenica]MBR0664685.1 DUF302 domain-containing protein [Plastoroseomonas hellenica]